MTNLGPAPIGSFSIIKPLSAMTTSPGFMKPKKPESLTMHLSELLPPIPGEKKQIMLLSVIAIRYLIVFDFLYSLHVKAIEIEAQSNWEYLDLLKINDSRVILDPLTIEDWSEERDSISMWPKVLFSDLFMYVNEANTALRKSLCILGGWLG